MRNILCATESCQIEDCAVKFSREIRVFPATRPAIINRRFSPHHTIGSLSVEQWGAEDLKDTRLTKNNEATARNEKGVRGKEMFLLGTPHNGKKKRRGRSISGGGDELRASSDAAGRAEAQEPEYSGPGSKENLLTRFS